MLSHSKHAQMMNERAKFMNVKAVFTRATYARSHGLPFLIYILTIANVLWLAASVKSVSECGCEGKD
jgi:hypothetical protein